MSGRLKVWFFVGLGHFFFALGAIGMFVPVMPAVPFFFLACWCYAKGSPKIHAAILRNRWIGEEIRNWEKDRSISRKAKLAAAFFLSLSAVYALIFVKIAAVQILFISVIVAAILFVLSRPSPK